MGLHALAGKVCKLSALAVSNANLADFVFRFRAMAAEAVPAYFGNVSEGFARQADVVLIVDEHELPAHSQYLSSHSRLFAQMMDTECSFSRSNPLRLQGPLERQATLCTKS